MGVLVYFGHISTLRDMDILYVLTRSLWWSQHC